MTHFDKRNFLYLRHLNSLFLISFPFFRRSAKGEDKKSAKAKAKENELRRAQAMEFKAIIQEMVDELQYMEGSSEKSEQSTEDYDAVQTEEAEDTTSTSFSGRSKDITDFESMLQARRRELMEKLETERGNEVITDEKSLETFDSATNEFMADEVKVTSEPKDKHQLEQNMDQSLQDFELPEQPEKKPTEDGVIEFDESKYFHEIPAPELKTETDLELEQIDIPRDVEVEIAPEPAFKDKKKAKKAKKGKKSKKEKVKTKKDRKKSRGVEEPDYMKVEYLEEVKILDELLGILSLAKKEPERVDMADIINVMEKIVHDYRTNENNVQEIIDPELDDKLDGYLKSIELDEKKSKESKKSKKLKGLKKLKKKKGKKKKRVKELEEMEELEEVEELEELDELDEVKEVEDDDVEELEEMEELEEIDDAKEAEDDDVEELEELEEVD
jgi:hypothetical protein